MKPLTRIKLAFAVVGLVLFGIGMRLDRPTLRFAGLGCVAGAWMLRFAKDRGDG